MAPPCFGDMGKSARDIFNKGYHFGLIKLDLKTKAEESIDIMVGGSIHPDTGKTFGALETKYKAKEYGVTFTEKWNTDNTLCTEVSLENKLIEGLKLSFDAMFSPPIGKKKARVKSHYQLEKITLDLDADLDVGGPLINGSSVIGHKGWLIGYQMAFDSNNKNITKNNFAVCFSNKEFEAFAKVNGGQEYSASLYQKLSPRLELGIQLAWYVGSNAARFEIGSRCDIDENTVARVKVDNSSRVGLSLQHNLHEAITLTMSAQIDAKNFHDGAHKVGLGLDLKP